MTTAVNPQSIADSALHHYVDTPAGKIHCACFGQGDAVILIHGFPDFWLTWWNQIEPLSKTRRVIAVDLPGFNESSGAKRQPISAHSLSGVITTVASYLGHAKFDLVGHDWGGYVAWQVAMTVPQVVRSLAVLGMPHPWAVARELARNPQQQEASAYARAFQHPNSHTQVPVSRLSAWITDERYKRLHESAMENTDLKVALDYYRNCFPAEPYREIVQLPPPIKVPTLVLQGLRDMYALPVGQDGLWQWVQDRLRIEHWPDAGHFLQHEKPDQVTRALLDWLASEEG